MGNCIFILNYLAIFVLLIIISDEISMKMMYQPNNCIHKIFV